MSLALADLTNGFPEERNLDIEGKNPQGLWQAMKTHYKHGDLLGAGSKNLSGRGDTEINEMGIV